MITESKQTLTYKGRNQGGGDRITSTHTYRKEKNKAKIAHSTEVNHLRDIVRNWMSTGTSSVFEYKQDTKHGKLFGIQLSHAVHVTFFVRQSNAGGKLYVFDRFFPDKMEYDSHLNYMRKKKNQKPNS
jgi:hypothetical protein